MASERSYLRLSALEKQIEETQAELDALTARKDSLDSKVVMMRPGSINRDLLDEQVRTILGYRSSDEQVIIRN